MTYDETICDALGRHYGALRHATKILARDAGAPHRSAENWLRKISAPKGENLINLMASNDAIAAEIMQLVAKRRGH